MSPNMLGMMMGLAQEGQLSSQDDSGLVVAAASGSQVFPGILLAPGTANSINTNCCCIQLGRAMPGKSLSVHGPRLFSSKLPQQL